MEDKLSLIIKISILIILVAISVITELLYKETLYNISLQFIVNIQKNIPYSIVIFSKIASLLVYDYALIISICLIITICKFQKTYILITILALSTTLYNYLKFIQQKPRPFWSDSNIINYSSDTDYGDPSGHALTSFSYYLTIIHFIIHSDYLKDKTIWKTILWIFGILILFSVSFSRLVLGVHSINQVLFGSLYGFLIYFLFIHIIQAHLINESDFFLIFTKNKYHLSIIISYVILIISIIVTYYSLSYDNRLYEIKIENKFPKKPEWKKFQYENYGWSLLCICVIGMHLGWQFFINNVSKNNAYLKIEALNNFNKTSFLKSILFFLIIIVFVLIFWIMIYFIPVVLIYDCLILYFFFIPFLAFLTVFYLCPLIAYELNLLNEDLNIEICDLEKECEENQNLIK